MQKKTLIWLGHSLDHLKNMPLSARKQFAFALELAMQCERHISARAITTFGLQDVMVVTAADRDLRYQLIYTTHFAGGVTKIQSSLLK